jgi:hypothetical protein
VDEAKGAAKGAAKGERQKYLVVKVIINILF